MSFARACKHLFALPGAVRRALPEPALQRIESAIKASETRHRGEIRFAVEAGLDFVAVLRGLTPRERALEVFSQLRVWDTEENIGVLIYVQLADHDIEIVADRGISAVIPQAHWDAVCHRMEEAFRAGRYEAGAIAAIEEITELLAAHFPARERNVDELPDRPVVL